MRRLFVTDQRIHTEIEACLPARPTPQSEPMEAIVMYLQIGFSDGRSVNAVLLTASPDRMRVALEDRADATELRLIDGRWIDAL